MHTKTLLRIMAAAVAATMANVSLAQTPAAAPAKPTSNAAPPASSTSANAITALCKDGTSFSGDSKKGACAGHKGVKTWTSDESPKSEPKADAAKNSQPVGNAAPGGGAGKVWLNTRSNVYHCQTDKYYGKTKKGEYMPEADAKAKGGHADHGKGCA